MPTLRTVRLLSTMTRTRDVVPPLMPKRTIAPTAVNPSRTEQVMVDCARSSATCVLGPSVFGFQTMLSVETGPMRWMSLSAPPSAPTLTS